MLEACRPGRTREIGAGSGRFGEVGPVVTIDVLPAVWLDAVADAQALPFATASFDNVVMLDVLHPIARPGVFFSEAGRGLRPGGRPVMTEPGTPPVHSPVSNLSPPETFQMSDNTFPPPPPAPAPP